MPRGPRRASVVQRSAARPGLLRSDEVGSDPVGSDVAERTLRAYVDGETVEVLLELGRSQPDERWAAGRQGTGYAKLDLLRLQLQPELDALVARSLAQLGGRVLGHDVWLLRYPEGTHIPDHRDPNELGDHHRLNLLLAGPGGLRLDGRAIDLRPGDAIVFRPDEVEHSVDAVDEERWVFSVGAVSDAR